MAQYCTIQNVKEVWKLAGQDFRVSDPVIDAQISAAIDEATSIANDLLQSRYSIATIELSIPTDVVSFTKTKAAIIVGSRFTTTASVVGQMLMEELKEQALKYKYILTQASLRDATGAIITVNPQESFTPFAAGFTA